MSVAIKVENLSKQYRLGLVDNKTVKEDLKGLWYKATGRSNPLLNKGELNDRSQKGNSKYVWSLKDVHFEVNEGEVLGIVGRNGAGKSTLLKLLSKITSPTTGVIKSRGRIASLLEVGTGFHPELTGRENVFLNGAILGMRKSEIRKKFDEIVDFSGVERYIDTPVKRYSSGMYVRLAFAVAAHLDSEILVIDEVLAVGDAEFQKKCIGKMDSISRSQGRTILFVSHNMESMLKLSSRCLMLEHGTVAMIGAPEETINKYIQSSINMSRSVSLRDRSDRQGRGVVRFTDTWIENIKGERVESFKVGDAIKIVATYESSEEDMGPISFAFAINTSLDVPLSDLGSTSSGFEFTSEIPHKGRVECRLPKVPYNVGEFYYNVMLRQNNEVEDWIINAGFFKIYAGDFFGSGKLTDPGRLILTEQSWNLKAE